MDAEHSEGVLPGLCVGRPGSRAVSGDGESERQWSWSGLRRVLRPMRDRVAELTVRLADAVLKSWQRRESQMAGLGRRVGEAAQLFSIRRRAEAADAPEPRHSVGSRRLVSRHGTSAGGASERGEGGARPMRSERDAGQCSVPGRCGTRWRKRRRRWRASNARSERLLAESETARDGVGGTWGCSAARRSCRSKRVTRPAETAGAGDLRSCGLKLEARTDGGERGRKRRGDHLRSEIAGPQRPAALHWKVSFATTLTPPIR